MGDVAIVKFYEDQVRSYQRPDGRKFVILRDPFLSLGLDPNQQIAQLEVIAGMGLKRVVPMDACDLDMMPMVLAQRII